MVNIDNIDNLDKKLENLENLVNIYIGQNTDIIGMKQQGQNKTRETRSLSKQK